MTESIEAVKAGAAAVSFKREVRAAVSDALDKFAAQTGICPSAIRLEMAHISGHGDNMRRYILTDVRLEFDL